MTVPWERNDKERRWEVRRQGIAVAWVTDEFTERVLDRQAAAVRLFNSLGSVPPPLADCIPPEPPVILAWVDRRDG